MRALLLTDSTAFSGTERHILDLALCLPREGVDVAIGCPTGTPLAQKAARENVDVIGVPRSGLVDWAAANQLKQLLRSNGFTLVHAHNGRTALAAALAADAGPVVASQHFLHPDHTSRSGAKGVLYRQAHLWVNRRVSHHIAISHAVQKEMLARREVRAERLSVVPNGVQNPDRKSLTPPEQLRAELGIPAQAPLVVCVARLEAEKCIDSLIEAMLILSEDVPNAVCLVAGQGSCHVALQAQIKRTQQSDQVRLLGFRDDALSLINAADVFVLPSLAEPSGLAILEAMALGKPVVATRAGGPCELVLDGETGLLVTPRDAPGLAEALKTTLQDPERAARMGGIGRLRYHQCYTAEHMSQQTAAVYQRVAASN